MRICKFFVFFFFSSRRRHTIFKCDWSSDVCSSDLGLIDFQTALGRMLREQNRDDYLRGVSLAESESRYLENLRDTAEFRFYAGVQRSWCIARAARAAYLTLSQLPLEERERLLDEWVNRGSGAQSFFHVEAEAFLDFIGERLSDRPREFTISQF